MSGILVWVKKNGHPGVGLKRLNGILVWLGEKRGTLNPRVKKVEWRPCLVGLKRGTLNPRVKKVEWHPCLVGLKKGNPKPQG